MSMSMIYFNKSVMRAVVVGFVVGMLTACGGGSTSSPSQVTPNNVVPVTVDLGPSGNSVNQLFASVTLCQPGSTSQCQTIDHVMVDTGSSGLRVFSAAIAPTM